MVTKESREYELVLVLPPNLPAKEQEVLLKRLKEELKKSGAKVVKEEKWGKKALAYQIEGYQAGVYFCWQVSFSTSPSLKEINLYLKREKNILRYLWVKKRRKDG